MYQQSPQRVNRAIFGFENAIMGQARSLMSVPALVVSKLSVTFLAGICFFSRMEPFVSLQCTILCKCFPALFAFERFLPRMSPKMPRDTSFVVESLRTNNTLKPRLLFMDSANVSVQRAAAGICCAALITLKGALPRVAPQSMGQSGLN